jgi:hypothetical protein
MVTKVESLVRVEITPAAPRQRFPPLIFVSQAPVSWFCVSAALPFATRRGTLYIVSFRSRRIHRDEDRRHQSNDVGTGRPHATKEFGRLGHARLALVPPLFHFFAPKSWSVEKLSPTKFQVIWTPFGSLKVKNIEIEVFWFSQVNPIKLGNL